MSQPDIGLLTTNSRVSGSVRTPAPTALYPWTLCRYRLMKNSTPNSAKKFSITAADPIVTERSRKIPSG